MTTLYQILQVHESASAAEIRRSYRRLVKVSHPDLGGDPKHFVAVQTAYEVLSSPLARRMYDLELAQQRRPFKLRVTGYYQGSLFEPTEFCIRKSEIVRALQEAAIAFDGKDCRQSLLTLADMFARMQ